MSKWQFYWGVLTICAQMQAIAGGLFNFWMFFVCVMVFAYVTINTKERSDDA